MRFPWVSRRWLTRGTHSKAIRLPVAFGWRGPSVYRVQAGSREFRSRGRGVDRVHATGEDTETMRRLFKPFMETPEPLQQKRLSYPACRNRRFVTMPSTCSSSTRSSPRGWRRRENRRRVKGVRFALSAGPGRPAFTGRPGVCHEKPPDNRSSPHLGPWDGKCKLAEGCYASRQSESLRENGRNAILLERRP